jgi:hypothetical protein
MWCLINVVLGSLSLSSTRRLVAEELVSHLLSMVVDFQLCFDDTGSPTGDPCGMRNAIALTHEVDSICKLPAWLGVGHRADNNWTGRNVDPWGIAETTAAGGHGYLC